MPDVVVADSVVEEVANPIVDDVSPPSPAAGADAQQCFKMIAIIMDNLMGLVNPDGEVYTRLSRAANIANGGLFRHLLYIMDFVYYVLFVYYSDFFIITFYCIIFLMT